MAATILGIYGLIAQVIVGLIMIPLSALLLMISTKIFKISDSSYKTAIKVALLVQIASIIFTVIQYFLPAPIDSIVGILQWILVTILLGLWLVKKSYNLDWGKGALVWLVWAVLSVVLAFVLALIIGIIVGIIFAGALIGLAAGAA